MFVFITILIVNACIAGTIPATPENITVTFLTPTTVRVSWQTMIDLNAHPVEKYIVTYKPTDDSYRVVQDVAGNSEAIILDRLSPSTQYSIAVTAIWLGKKYRSRQIIFRTLDLPKSASQQDNLNSPGLGGSMSNNNMAGPNNLGTTTNVGRSLNIGNGSGIDGDDGTLIATNISHGTHRELPTIRGVEIGIVLIVLMVWAGAIALFFNRWGKIRMLLPYQPEFKNEQLKVPGTGVCTGGGCNGQHSHQNFHMLHEERSTSISERCTRSRINSAIFVSSEGRGFDSIEFLRRHGSQSVLCRKAKSAENITDNARKKSFSDQRHWRTDEEPEYSRALNSTQSSAGDFELKECRSGVVEGRVLSVLNSNAEQTTAVTTAANLIVGSISIEAPPSNIFDDTNSVKSMRAPKAHISITSTISASHDSSDTVEELVQIATSDTATNMMMTDGTTIVPVARSPSPVLPSTSQSFASALAMGRRSRVLVRQRTSAASPIGSRSQSPASASVFFSPSPKPLVLKSVKPKIINNLPMVSISGPSPQEEKPECL